MNKTKLRYHYLTYMFGDFIYVQIKDSTTEQMEKLTNSNSNSHILMKISMIYNQFWL